MNFLGNLRIDQHARIETLLANARLISSRSAKVNLV
jgi:hypothetical protein